MILTEQEAREKWCPMSRTSNGIDNDVTVNRTEIRDIIAETRCIASDCMMWQQQDRDLGYCGLAGHING